MPETGVRIPVAVWPASASHGHDSLRGDFLTVGEDPREIAADEEPVCDCAERAEGERVADPIVDEGCAVAVRLEEMGVLPERVGAPSLGVDEAGRGGAGLAPG